MRDFNQEWVNWLQELNTRKEEMAQLDFQHIYQQIAPRTKEDTIRFMKNWQIEVLKTNRNLDELDQLVKRQEIRIKGSRAKLNNPSGEYENWVGIQKLEYRFFQVRSIISDIHKAIHA